MYRLVLLCCIAMAALVSNAAALEMFTSFHNGENVGFPPLEVPTKFYGHGGWHATAQCRPERIESIEPVPAMTPTGRAAVSPTGFIRRDRGRRGNDMQHFGNQRSDNQQIENPQSNNQPVDNQGQYVSDRRRSSGTSDTSMVGYNQQGNDYDTSQSPTPAKIAPKSDGWTRSLEPAPTDDQKPVKRPTSVYAQPGSAPLTESLGKTKSNAQGTTDPRTQPAGSGSSRRRNDLPSVMPPQRLD